jgi:large subunit ribosomal protein L20
MPRATNAPASRERRRKKLKQVKGFRGARSKNVRTANNALMKKLLWQYRDRRRGKREFRKLWIIRIGAAAKDNGISYSRFISGLEKAGVRIDRKILANLAVNNQRVFKELVGVAKQPGLSS